MTPLGDSGPVLPRHETAEQADARALALLGEILRFDRKLTSYKFALLRAVSELAVLAPATGAHGLPVAVPLRRIAGLWLGYYWPFCDVAAPILQGPRNQRDGALHYDIRFRPELERLRAIWTSAQSQKDVADGAVLAAELSQRRRRASYGEELLTAFDAAIDQITTAVLYPIQHVGGGRWSVFPRPARWAQVADRARAIPGTRTDDLCLVVPFPLWRALQRHAAWVEALCLQHWSHFVESLDQGGGRHVDRGTIFRLLTQRPRTARPTSWEYEQVELLIQKGEVVTCPWTGRELRRGVRFELDRILPVALLPSNELWNLIPVAPQSRRLRSAEQPPSGFRLAQARPALAQIYEGYERMPSLGAALREDAAERFGSEPTAACALVGAVCELVERLRGVPPAF